MLLTKLKLLQLGTLPVAITPWPSESKDTTIAAVIRQIMRWAPDTLMVVDNTTSPPTCNFVSRAAAGVYSADVSGDDYVVNHSIRDCADLIPEAVCINYEYDDDHNSNTFRRIEQDLAPVLGNCLAPGTVNITVPMRGVRQLIESVAVKTTKIPGLPKRNDPGCVGIGETNGTLSSNSIAGRAWWLRHAPELRNLRADMANDVLIDVEEDSALYVSGEANGPGITIAETVDEPDPPEPF